MTEAAAPARQPEPTEFLQIWSESFSQVVGQITGSPVPCVTQAEAPPIFRPPTKVISGLWSHPRERYGER